MPKLRDICREKVRLAEEDIVRLENLEKELPLIAALTDGDVFIDCFLDEFSGIVVAHAKPTTGHSAYETDVLGAPVLFEMEPAVFRARDTRLTFSDLKAITQESKAVRQNVVPILGKDQQVIAVLIREKDITDNIRRDQKYEELAKKQQIPSVNVSAENTDALAVREMNHRIKNNLQLVASVLNLQAIQSSSGEVRAVLEENIERVLSIASIHDMIAAAPDCTSLSCRELLFRLKEHIITLVPPDKNINVTVISDDFQISPDTATSVAMVVTELTVNAILHAFPHKNEGTVTVAAMRGSMYHTIVVSDDGCGFDPEHNSGNSLGLEIVRSTVHDKLAGKLRMQFEVGTKISFDFKGDCE